MDNNIFNMHAVVLIIALNLIINNCRVASNDLYHRGDDKYGNIVFDNRTVSWIPHIPEGNVEFKTLPTVEVSKGEEYYSLPRGFVNMMKPEDNLNTIRRVLNEKLNIKEDLMKIIFSDLHAGFITCIIIGVAFIVLLPLSGLCCICVQCCCKKKEKKHSSQTRMKRICFSVTLVIFSLFIMVAVHLVIVSSTLCDFIINRVDKVTTDILTDMKSFITDTTGQFRYVCVDMYKLIADVIVHEITSLHEHVEKTAIRTLNANRIVNAFGNAETGYVYLQTPLENMMSNVEKLKSSIDNFTKAISHLAWELDNIIVSCKKDCPATCSMIDTNLLRPSKMHLDEIPAYDEILSKCKSFADSRLHTKASDMVKKLGDMHYAINDMIDPVRKDFVNTIRQFEQYLTDLTENITAEAETMFPIIDKVNRSVQEYSPIVKDINVYRHYSVMLLAGLFATVGFLFVASVIAGLGGQDKGTLPHERGCISNSAGHVIMGNVYFMLFIGGPLMIITTPLFLVGASLQFVCEPINNMDIFTNFIDKGGIPDFNLGSMMYNDSSLQIHLYNVAVGCRENKSLYTLLQVNRTFPLEKLADFSQYLEKAKGYLANIKNVNLTDFSLNPEYLQAAIRDINASIVNKMDVKATYRALNKVTAWVTNVLPSSAMNSLNDKVTAIQAACGEQLKSKLAAFMTKLRNTLTKERKQISSVISGMNNTISKLQYSTDKLKHWLKKAGMRMAKADKILMTKSFLPEVSTAFGKIIGAYLASYRDHALHLIHNEVGACRPLWNIYSSATDLVCSHVSDGLNGFWFGIGWALAFFIPAIIFGAMLSPFFRRMAVDDHITGYIENIIREINQPFNTWSYPPKGQGCPSWSHGQSYLPRATRDVHVYQVRTPPTPAPL
ncbi:prominin-1-A-like isoform X2 [Gigantopelta aegis]|uniref:prominin-1-A-like isoform X2 n=1 Tax=Gigantopelta aegis TaxID=1735272 RepID=UPI001B88E13C|nr:prominin-1-A-like isoform X2 [Gigantopelta aegis]